MPKHVKICLYAWPSQCKRELAAICILAYDTFRCSGPLIILLKAWFESFLRVCANAVYGLLTFIEIGRQNISSSLHMLFTIRIIVEWSVCGWTWRSYFGGKWIFYVGISTNFAFSEMQKFWHQSSIKSSSAMNALVCSNQSTYIHFLLN